MFEFLPDGTMVQRGLPEASAAPAPAVSRRATPTTVPASRAQYRALAEDVALAYAGGPGPRAAGLDALTFQRVFVALVRQESGFNPRAVSPLGAGSGSAHARNRKAARGDGRLRPHQNLNGAARYFTQQLARFRTCALRWRPTTPVRIASSNTVASRPSRKRGTMSPPSLPRRGYAPLPQTLLP